MGAEDCGSADDQSRWFGFGGKVLTVWVVRGLGNFRHLTNQPFILSVSQLPTNWPFCQPAKLSTVVRLPPVGGFLLRLLTSLVKPSLIARASPPP